MNYSDEAIRAFGLDPDLLVGAPALGAAAVGADSPEKPPLLMEYPDQPSPLITIENVNSVMGKDSKKKVGGKEKHIFWAKTECGLVLSSVTPWEIISKEKGVTTGGYMCKPSIAKASGECNSPGPNHWTEQGQEGELAAHHG